MKSIQYYFTLWRIHVSQIKMFRDYDEWCEINNERLSEEKYAQETKMDPIHWCWNCKYSSCDRHI